MIWIKNNLAVASKSEIIKIPYKTVDVRDLVDKEGNPTELILEKIDEAIDLIKNKHKVVIFCDQGFSRSNAIAIGVLVKYFGYNFDDAVKLVVKKTGRELINLDLLNTVKRALKINDGRSKTKKTILITGASGFIGSALVNLLKKEKKRYELITPSRFEVDLLMGPIELDLLVKRTGADLIVHLASPRIYTTPQAMGEMIIMLKNVLEVCRINGIPIIYPSSWVVFGGYFNKDLVRASENLEPLPRDNYGQAKFLCEILLNYYKKVYSLKVCLLRISPVYGRGSDKPKFIWNFFEKAKNNIEIFTHEYKNGLPILDLIHVSDVASAIKAVIEKNFFGVLHIGTGVGLSTFEIAHKIKEICKSKSEISVLKINDYNPNIVMDISKAKKILGWQPTISIEEGLKSILSE
jgi:nucleoside-diphosphate-sugar epimerase